MVVLEIYFMTQGINNLQILSTDRCRLGEGVQIDKTGEICGWVDIKSDRYFIKHGNFQEPRTYSGLIAPSKILSVDNSQVKVLHKLGISEINLSNGNIKNLVTFSTLLSSHRSNDGEIFPDGSIWYSRMGINEEFGMGSIWRWDANSGEDCVIEGMTIPNKILKHPTNDSVYFADSATGSIFVGDAPSLGSKMDSIETFAAFENSLGVPDGSCLDAMGNIWNCRWGAGLVIVLSPIGKIVDQIKLPVKYPTSCKLDSTETTLFVTSANPEETYDDFSGHTLKIEIA